MVFYLTLLSPTLNIRYHCPDSKYLSAGIKACILSIIIIGLINDNLTTFMIKIIVYQIITFIAWWHFVDGQIFERFNNAICTLDTPLIINIQQTNIVIYLMLP
jgi:hypothetical protein